ncbi:MAG: M23 family metallopeptidase [Cyanobacteria bacterium P01_D01_bin.105]
MALLFLGVPTVSLGGVCFSLLQNNLRLSEANEELNEMANEVKAEVDSLGEEIDSLRERAGVPASEVPGSTQKQSSSSVRSNEVVAEVSEENTTELSIRRASLLAPGGEALANALPAQGGPAQAVEAKELLEDARRQVPELSRTLDSAIKPALEKALAEEAAFPSGQPVLGKAVVSSEFGIRGNPFGGGGYEMHEGIDFIGDVGDKIAAAGDGVVLESGWKGGYGITVVVDHGNGYETLYAHLSGTKVAVGDRVKRGQIVGYLGNTGRSTGPHLHYGIYEGDKAINPRTLLKLSE